jgi:hypothetical protein
MEEGEERQKKSVEGCRLEEEEKGEGRRKEKRDRKSVEGCRLEEEEKGYDSQQYCLEVADRIDSCGPNCRISILCMYLMGALTALVAVLLYKNTY